ncbi:uncharacterized protein (DUF983 family) [Lachnospiraceae bacterium PF1-21]
MTEAKIASIRKKSDAIVLILCVTILMGRSLWLEFQSLPSNWVVMVTFSGLLLLTHCVKYTIRVFKDSRDENEGRRIKSDSSK